MSSKKDRPIGGMDQAALPGTEVERRQGPTERGVSAAIEAAKQAEMIAAADEGACQLAITLAATVDWCSVNAEPHTLATNAGKLSDLLTKLRLEPASRLDSGGGGDDEWSQALRDFADPANDRAT